MSKIKTEIASALLQARMDALNKGIREVMASHIGDWAKSENRDPHAILQSDIEVAVSALANTAVHALQSGGISRAKLLEVMGAIYDTTTPAEQTDNAVAAILKSAGKPICAAGQHTFTDRVANLCTTCGRVIRADGQPYSYKKES